MNIQCCWERTLVAKRSVAFCLLLALVGYIGAAQSNVVVSRLTLDGELTKVTAIAKAPQRRVGLSERGRPIRIDEYALVVSSTALTPPKVQSKAFPFVEYKQRQELVNVATVGSNRWQVRPNPREPVIKPALLIMHQAVHPANHAFTPTPNATFVAQAVSSARAESGRGFAIVDIGESGKVIGIRMMNANGVVVDRALQSAIASGMRTDFLDERRHGHTVYMVYELTGQTVGSVGTLFVSFPECVPPCQ